MNIATLITSLAANFAVVDHPYETALERAIHMVESSGRLTGDKPILGDWCPHRGEFLSRGPLQISRAAWIDADMPGKYEDVDDLEYSLRTFRKYMARYATERRLGRKPTLEDEARIWNGGPNGYKRAATKPYWNKTLEELK
tara:strand:+ start:649 stop:1071 length:423 start_codon:yes stop_codon:yes gene_type:complete